MLSKLKNINIIYLLIHLNLYHLTVVVYLLKPPQEISIFFHYPQTLISF